MIAALTPEQLRLLLSLATASAADRERLPSDVVRRHDALVRRGRLPPVVEVKDGCCAGCHMRVAASVAYRIRSVAGAYACPACHRLLYDPGHLASKPEGPRGRTKART